MDILNVIANFRDRFPTDHPVLDFDTNTLISIFTDIKELKNAFPNVKISTRSNFQEVLIANIKGMRDHSIQMRFDQSWKFIDHQLPLSTDNFPPNSNLIGCVTAYILLLDNLKPFYSALKILDDVCCVGEPEMITTKTNWRLVKYSKRVFIKIEFTSPLNIDDVLVTFHGCTDAVREMTEIYNSRCEDYEDEDESIYYRLLNIFDIPYFPATDEDTIDCSICLCFRCENNRCPVVCCDNEKCDSTFHIGCLEKYLKVQKHVQVLTISIGECPFCKHTLSNSYASFFQNLKINEEEHKDKNKVNN